MLLFMNMNWAENTKMREKLEILKVEKQGVKKNRKQEGQRYEKKVESFVVLPRTCQVSLDVLF